MYLHCGYTCTYMYVYVAIERPRAAQRASAAQVRVRPRGSDKTLSVIAAADAAATDSELSGRSAITVATVRGRHDPGWQGVALARFECKCAHVRMSCTGVQGCGRAGWS